MSFKKNDRVIYRKNGKPYIVGQAFYDTAPRNGFDATGKLVLRVYPINPKTGEPWQAGMVRPATDFG